MLPFLSWPQSKYSRGYINTHIHTRGTSSDWMCEMYHTVESLVPCRFEERGMRRNEKHVWRIEEKVCHRRRSFRLKERENVSWYYTVTHNPAWFCLCCSYYSYIHIHSFPPSRGVRVDVTFSESPAKRSGWTLEGGSRSEENTLFIENSWSGEGMFSALCVCSNWNERPVGFQTGNRRI